MKTSTAIPSYYREGDDYLSQQIKRWEWQNNKMQILDRVISLIEKVGIPLTAGIFLVVNWVPAAEFEPPNSIKQLYAPYLEPSREKERKAR